MAVWTSRAKMSWEHSDLLPGGFFQAQYPGPISPFGLFKAPFEHSDASLMTTDPGDLFHLKALCPDSQMRRPAPLSQPPATLVCWLIIAPPREPIGFYFLLLRKYKIQDSLKKAESRQENTDRDRISEGHSMKASPGLPVTVYSSVRLGFVTSDNRAETNGQRFAECGGILNWCLGHCNLPGIENRPMPFSRSERPGQQQSQKALRMEVCHLGDLAETKAGSFSLCDCKDWLKTAVMWKGWNVTGPEPEYNLSWTIFCPLSSLSLLTSVSELTSCG